MGKFNTSVKGLEVFVLGGNGLRDVFESSRENISCVEESAGERGDGEFRSLGLLLGGPSNGGLDVCTEVLHLFLHCR